LRRVTLRNELNACSDGSGQEDVGVSFLTRGEIGPSLVREGGEFQRDAAQFCSDLCATKFVDPANR
jgi:hypothetical protein